MPKSSALINESISERDTAGGLLGRALPITAAKRASSAELRHAAHAIFSLLWPSRSVSMVGAAAALEWPEDADTVGIIECLIDVHE